MVIQHFLEGNEVIDENFIGRLKGHRVRNIIRLCRGGIEETTAIALSDKK